MIVSRKDMPQLKWGLLAFLSTLCAGGAAIVSSQNFVAHAQSEHQAAQRQLNAARSRLAAAGEDRENMKAYKLEYGKLLKRKLIGDGQRLDWVEGLENIRKQKLVLNFSYAITPQHAYTPPGKPDSASLELYRSDMSLQLDLLHEEQLLDFFDAMRTGIQGWFILDHCSMERGTDAHPQLRAACSGGWLTLKHVRAE